MTLTCPHGCGELLGNACDCANNAPLAAELVCANCGLEPPYGDWDDCLRCQAAVIIANPAPFASNRKWYVGSQYLRDLDAEIARQTPVPQLMRRQAS